MSNNRQPQRGVDPPAKRVFRIDGVRQLPHRLRDRGERKFGPDLTHLMSRETIASGAAPQHTRDAASLD